jgi:hypothetical protein
MAVRVDVDEVKDIFQVSADSVLSDDQIEIFVSHASMLVDQLEDTGKDYTANELKMIELYLTAHFCSLRDQRVYQEKVDDLFTTFQGKTGMGLDATHYGQMAKTFDRYGLLQNLGKKRSARVLAVPSFD